MSLTTEKEPRVRKDVKLPLGALLALFTAGFLGIINETIPGFGFGGSATLFVTAGIRAAGTDGVQSILVTVFNLSIAAGGVLGGLVLSGPGVTAIPWTAAAIMIPTVIATIAGRRHAFPHWPAGA